MRALPVLVALCLSAASIAAQGTRPTIVKPAPLLTSDQKEVLSWFMYGILILLGLALILVPPAIAFRRSHPHAVPITAMSMLIGVSGVGFLVALAWALSSPPRRVNEKSP